MARRKSTGFDKYVRARMKDPAFEAEYAEARAEVEAVDRLVRFLDEARITKDLNKAELARRIGAKPEIVRRLFTARAPNPTVRTLMKVAAALGLRLELVPDDRSGTPRRRRDGERASA